MSLGVARRDEENTARGEEPRKLVQSLQRIDDMLEDLHRRHHVEPPARAC